MGDGFAYGSNVSSSGQPWTTGITLSASGQNLSTLFGLYPTNGGVTIGTGTTSINTTQDGPIQVVRYGALTVNGTLTATNRCRGLCILCDSLTMGASGIITMSGLGAAGSSKWANQDILIPTSSMIFSGAGTSIQRFFSFISSTGYAIFDPTLYACPPPGFGDVTANFASWPGNGTAIISASGCGAGGASVAASAGAAGGAGTTGPGGGGSGGANTGLSCPAAHGMPWGGGPGGGATNSTTLPVGWIVDQYGGNGGSATAGSNNGGGAGNPGGAAGASGVAGGTGTGGVLIVIARGTVNLTAGHALTANGMAGGGTAIGGGGSGGGKSGLYYLGALTGSPNLTATGGAAGSGSSYAGGAGGAGQTESKTFSQMGY